MKKKTRKILKQYERVVVGVLAVIFLSGCIAMYIFLHANEPDGAKRLVTFYDRGIQRVVLTRATTVEAALNAANIQLNSQDTVEPTLDSKLSSSNESIIIYRSRLIVVVDGKIRQTVLTVAQSPNAILKAAQLEPLGTNDKAKVTRGDLAADGSSVVLTVERVKQEPVKPEPVVFKSRPNALTVSKGAHVFVDSAGVAHRETYYDLPMNIVIRACGAGGTYTIRADGAKVDKDGYVLVAANLNSYPRCSVVETSLGSGKVYDTGGFALKHPYGFDLATDWTNYNGL